MRTIALKVSFFVSFVSQSTFKGIVRNNLVNIIEIQLAGRIKKDVVLVRHHGCVLFRSSVCHEDVDHSCWKLFVRSDYTDQVCDSQNDPKSSWAWKSSPLLIDKCVWTRFRKHDCDALCSRVFLRFNWLEGSRWRGFGSSPWLCSVLFVGLSWRRWSFLLKVVCSFWLHWPGVRFSKWPEIFLGLKIVALINW